MAGGRSRGTGRVGKNARGGRKSILQKNPLFQALENNNNNNNNNDDNNNHGRKKGNPANELSIRLGLVRPKGRKELNKAKNYNINNKRLTTNKSNQLKENALAKALNIRLASTNTTTNNNNSNLRSSYPGSDRQRNSKSLNRDTINSSRNINRSGSSSQSLSIRSAGNNSRNRSNKENINSNNGNNAEDITFKNASLIPFLRIENLTPDVSESDIRMVLTTKLGQTLKILKMSSTFDNKPAITAEVFFVNNEKLEDYARSLNNVRADGRVLKAKVAYNSWIINSDKLWDAILRDIRVLKQQFVKRSLAQEEGQQQIIS
jgi:hypothetical protein